MGGATNIFIIIILMRVFYSPGLAYKNVWSMKPSKIATEQFNSR